MYILNAKERQYKIMSIVYINTVFVFWLKNFNNKTDIYLHCLKKLKLSNKDCLAIEDTEISLKYAKKAKLRCVAFPGDYHRSGKYKDSFIKVKRLNSKIFADL